MVSSFKRWACRSRRDLAAVQILGSRASEWRGEVKDGRSRWEHHVSAVSTAKIEKKNGPRSPPDAR